VAPIAEDLKALARRAYAIMGGGDLDELDELMVPGFIDHDPEPDQAPGAEGVKAAFRRMRSAFPDLKLTPEAIYTDGDTVIARVRVTGTHNGEYFGILPTGKRIDVAVIDITRIEGGRAVERWGVVDGFKLMQQLGQVPAG
jgi:predicted ester cyclase